MEAPDVQFISSTHLLTPFAGMYPDGSMDIIAWKMEEMAGGVGNPVSLGLYRFGGQILANDQTEPFSLVLKVIHSPLNRDLRGFGGEEEPTHWNYWRREPLFYQSDLVRQIPPGMVVPQCYVVENWDDQIIWLWLEDIEQGRGDIQEIEDLDFLAYQLGRLNGKFAQPANLPNTSWLGRDTNAQWLKPIPGVPNPLKTVDGRPNWDHPFIQTMFPPQETQAYRRFWTELERFLGLPNALPLTWCHGDGAPANFKIRQTRKGGKELVALDWALTNIGVVGEDLAQLLYASYQDFAAEEWEHLIQRLFRHYLAGLREMGWAGEEDHVWLGCAATVLIKYSAFLLLIIGVGLNSEDLPDPTEEQREAARFLEQVARIAQRLAS